MRKIKIEYYDSIPKVDKIGKYRALYEYEKTLNKKIFCPVIEENKKRMKDYEAYDTMHTNDGVIGKSRIPTKL